jgi:hypothetical protein
MAAIHAHQLSDSVHPNEWLDHNYSQSPFSTALISSYSELAGAVQPPNPTEVQPSSQSRALVDRFETPSLYASAHELFEIVASTVPVQIPGSYDECASQYGTTFGVSRSSNLPEQYPSQSPASGFFGVHGIFDLNSHPPGPMTTEVPYFACHSGSPFDHSPHLQPLQTVHPPSPDGWVHNQLPFEYPKQDADCGFYHNPTGGQPPFSSGLASSERISEMADSQPRSRSASVSEPPGTPHDLLMSPNHDEVFEDDPSQLDVGTIPGESDDYTYDNRNGTSTCIWSEHGRICGFISTSTLIKRHIKRRHFLERSVKSFASKEVLRPHSQALPLSVQILHVFLLQQIQSQCPP